jgi:hypothetical protein
MFVLTPVAGILAALSGGIDLAADLDLSSPIYYVISLPSILGATWFARRTLDRRSFISLGFDVQRHPIRDLVFGVTLNGVMMGLIYLIEWGFGWLTFEGWAWESTAGPAWLGELAAIFIAFLIVGFQEELLSRGYQLQNLVEGVGLPAALVISSILFALLHSFNPGASLFSTVGLTLAGLFLAYGWVSTRQLWLPIGLHIGWNLFEGPVFGFPVSGNATFRLIRHTVTGPGWLTGGEFGPEAGAVLLPALLVGAIGIWLYTRDGEPARR